MMRSESKYARHGSGWLAGALLAAGLVLGSMPLQARAQHEEHARAEHEDGGPEHEAHGEHAHGEHGAHEPVTLQKVFSDKRIWISLINFGLLVFLLVRNTRKPLASFLTTRRSEMEREISAAAEMRAKAEAKFQEYSARMAQLDDELGKLRKDIERGAQEDKARIMAEADETARRLRRETESLIEQHAKSLGDSIRRELVTAAVSRAELLLRESVTESDQERIAQTYVQSVSHEASLGGGQGRASANALPQEQS